MAFTVPGYVGYTDSRFPRLVCVGTGCGYFPFGWLHHTLRIYYDYRLGPGLLYCHLLHLLPVTVCPTVDLPHVYRTRSRLICCFCVLTFGLPHLVVVTVVQVTFGYGWLLVTTFTTVVGLTGF